MPVQELINTKVTIKLTQNVSFYQYLRTLRRTCYFIHKHSSTKDNYLLVMKGDP